MTKPSPHITTVTPAELPAFTGTRRATIRFQAVVQALRARHHEWWRRELDAGQTARAHHREVGGDFHILP